MLRNLETINKLYRDYKKAGENLSNAVEETFREVFEDNGMLQAIDIMPTYINSPCLPEDTIIDRFYYNVDNTLILEDRYKKAEYHFEKMTFRPEDMYALYQSLSQTLKIKQNEEV